MVIRSRTPVRIDFSGGWTDVALFTEESKGFVVNATISIYSYVTIKKLPDKEVLKQSYGYNHKEKVENKNISIYSADFDIYNVGVLSKCSYETQGRIYETKNSLYFSYTTLSFIIGR
jgi:D-glycero-alpha-D-manno-heptose-7-phosphate kinase